LAEVPGRFGGKEVIPLKEGNKECNIANDCAVDVIILSRNCEVIRLTSSRKSSFPQSSGGNMETKMLDARLRTSGMTNKYGFLCHSRSPQAGIHKKRDIVVQNETILRIHFKQ